VREDLCVTLNFLINLNPLIILKEPMVHWWGTWWLSHLRSHQVYNICYSILSSYTFFDWGRRVVMFILQCILPMLLVLFFGSTMI